MTKAAEGLWDSNVAGITGYFPERTFETEELAGPDGLGVGRVVGEEERRVAAMSDVYQEVCSGRVMERWSGQSSGGKIFLYFFSIKQMRVHLEDQQKTTSPEDRRGREGSYRSRVSRDGRVPLSPGAAYLAMLIES